MQNIDTIFKAFLLFSLSIATLGISWQLMHLLKKMSELLEEFKQTNKKANEILNQASTDYKLISESIHQTTENIKLVNKKVLKPIQNIGKIIQSFISFLKIIQNRFIPSRNSEKKNY